MFCKIAATVTDVGGIMSHAAIVCREYGLPAVTGTAFGTKTIKTGQRLRVDGNTGAVTIYDSFIDGLTDSSGTSLIDSQGTLFPSTITFSVAAAAPEPSTWALLMLAVGAAGLGVRRRRTELPRRLERARKATGTAADTSVFRRA